MRIVDEFDKPVPTTPTLRALVDAYAAAWKERYGSEPKQAHPLDALGLYIEFT